MLQVDYVMERKHAGYEPFYGCEMYSFQDGFLHCHDSYELYLHFNGGDYYSVNNEVYPLSSNQLMLLPPFCIHGLLPGSRQTMYERGYLYLTSDMLKTLGYGQIDFEHIFEKHALHGRYQFRIPEQAASECKSLFQQMMMRQDNDTPLNTVQDYAAMLALLCIICRQISKPENDIQPVVFSRSMHEVLRYINKHFTEALTLEDIALEFHLSSSYISHAFLKHTGRSVYDYILFRRVMLAKELLHSDLPLNTIAYQCGFNDYSNFLRMFKKYEKCSPSFYRKNLHLTQTITSVSDFYHP